MELNVRAELETLMFWNYTEVVKVTVNSELASAWFKRTRPTSLWKTKSFQYEPITVHVYSVSHNSFQCIKLDPQLVSHLRWFWYAPWNFPLWLQYCLCCHLAAGHDGEADFLWNLAASCLALFLLPHFHPQAFSIAAERQSTSNVLEQQFLVELSFLIDINCQL